MQDNHTLYCVVLIGTVLFLMFAFKPTKPKDKEAEYRNPHIYRDPDAEYIGDRVHDAIENQDR